jgi:NADPH-dependent curcumin reductase CurA
MTRVNRRIVLASRPQGEPVAGNFRLEEQPVPAPGENEVLLETLFLSLDPYIRGCMNDGKSYITPIAIDGVIEGGTVSRVLESRHAGLVPGDIVLGYTGWQTHAVVAGAELRKVDTGPAPISTALGVLGMPGMTAYTGLLNIGQPKAGETLVVAAATGPVGSLVGQIGLLKGCRVIGIAGGPEKTRYLTEELGFDVGLDHRDPAMPAKLAVACPKGIDIYFENVGGHVWEAVFPLLNDFARVPVCGLIAHYNDTGTMPGPDRLQATMRAVLTKRLTLRGFIVTDFAAQEADFEREVGAWLRAGRIKYKEDVVIGLEQAPAAFIGLLKGRNFGKLVVQVAAH